MLTLDSPSVVIDSGNLPGDLHPDPGDRFLVVIAQRADAMLVTQDQKIIEYGKAGHVHALAS